MSPSFIRTAFPLAAPRPTLDVLKDTSSPRLKHSPSTTSTNSQSSVSISIRRRVSTLVSKFHLRTSGSLRGRPRMRTSSSTSSSASITTTSATHNSMGRRKSRYAAVENISTIPWPRSPSRSPSPLSPDIRPPSGLGRRASSISELEIAALERDYPLPLTPPATAPLLASPRSPIFPRSPTNEVRHESVLTPVPPSSFCQYPAAQRTRTLSSPARLSTYNETSPLPPPPATNVESNSDSDEPPPPPPKDLFLLSSTLHTPSSIPATPCTPCTPRRARLQARQSPPIPLSLLFPYIPRADLPTLSLVSRRFRNAAQLTLYRTLVLSSSDDDNTDACMARLAAAPHLAALVTTLIIPAYPPAHGASFKLALALALRSMRALRNLTLPAYDADILDAVTEAAAAAIGEIKGLTHLTLLADTLPFSFFDEFLVSNPTVRHLSLPNFVGVPPGPSEVHPMAVPNLISLDTNPGLAVSLAHGRLLTLRQVTLRVTSTLYDGLRPAAIFGSLFGPGGGQVKVLSLVLAADVDRRTRGRLLGALAKTGEGLEVLELQLEGKSDEVALQVLYKQVGTLLPNVCALRTLRLRTERTIKTAAKTEEGPSRLALCTRSRSLGSALRCIVFPSGSRWELEQGEWLRVN